MKLKMVIFCLLLSHNVRAHAGRELVNDLIHYSVIYLVASELLRAPWKNSNIISDNLSDILISRIVMLMIHLVVQIQFNVI